MSSSLDWRSELKQGDIAAIRNMAVRAGVFSEEEIGVAVELAEDKLTKGSASDYHFMLADIHDALVGYTCFGRIPLTEARYDLYWIVVSADIQQKGIASALMGQTETSLHALGGRILYAETSSRAIYAPAHGFYRKQGFTESACLKDFYADGDDKLIFSKLLVR